MTKEPERRVNMRIAPDVLLHSAIVAYQKHVLIRQHRQIDLDEATYELIRMGIDTIPEVKQFIAA